MRENKKIELWGKLVTGNVLAQQNRLRAKDSHYKSIVPSELDHYVQEGWILQKKNIKSFTITKKKSHDVEFEDKVWNLFANLGYQVMNGDRNFALPYDKENENLTQQIDVFAKDEETILMVECKSAKEFKRGDFKKELEAMSGKIDGLRKAAKLLFPDTNPKIKFILATNNYSISEEDLTRLGNLGGFHLDEDNLEYFQSLYFQLGTAARYQLLGGLFQGQDISSMNNQIPAVEGKMGGHTYYSFSIEPEKLLKIGYVLHRNKANVNMMPTYQRLIKKSRLKLVHEFIEEGGYFPNSIVVNIDAEKLRFDRANTQSDTTISKLGILYLPKKYRSVYIIDGQHRLYGYSSSDYKVTNTIPVVAFLNLSRAEQVRLFMQINENQKAVSKDLRNTLNADLLWESDSKIEQQKALKSRISLYLGEHKSSPLYNLVSIGEDKKIITTQTIDNALKRSSFLGKVTKTRIETVGSFYDGDFDYTYKQLKAYLSEGIAYIAEHSKEEWEKGGQGVLLINKGIYSIIMILSDILYFMNEKGIVNSKKDNIRTIITEAKAFLDPVIHFLNGLTEEEKNDLKKTYGAGGDAKYWRSFQQAVRGTFVDFNPEGLEDYLTKEAKVYNVRAFELIRDIEIGLKNDFKSILQDEFGKKWFEKGVPVDAAKDAVTLAYTKNIDSDEDLEVEPWDCLTIIVYRKIALKHWQSLFEKEYTMPGEEKKQGGKEEKTKWMVQLEHIRNQNVHSYSITEEEFSFLERLHDWLITKELRNKFQTN